jgi:iron(III) transport system permease protein
MTALAVLALAVPLVSLGRWLVVGSSTDFPAGQLAVAALTSVGLGLAGAVVAVVLALPVVWLAVRHRGRLSGLVERSTYIVGSLPGVVVALALVTLSVRTLPAVYQTVFLLVAAYVMLFMPRAVVSLRAALVQIPPEIEESARALGAAPAAVLRRVTLPLLARGMGTGGALVFLAVATELTATLLLAPIGTTTLATEFWAQSYQLAYGAAAPYAFLMIAISAPAAWLLTRETRREVVA